MSHTQQFSFCWDMMLQSMALSDNCPYDMEGLLSLPAKQLFEQKKHYDYREALEAAARLDAKNNQK